MEKDVPYIVFESSEARHERTQKRLIIALVICLFMLFATNMAWIHFIGQYELESEVVSVDGHQGDANYIGNNGDIINVKDNR